MMSTIRAYLLLLLYHSIKTVNSANILGVFLFPSISHQIVYQPIWRELSLRGHQVTVITPNPLNDPTLINLTEIDVHHTYEILKTHRLDYLVSKDLNRIQFLKNIYDLMEIIAVSELEHVDVQRLLHDTNRTFDLILIEPFHPIMFGLAGRFKAPLIGVSSLGVMLVGHDAIGNPSHPVLNPDMFYEIDGIRMSLLEKFQSIFHNIYYRYFFNYQILPKVDRMARKYFGNDIPYIGDLHNNMSLLFLNVNPLLYTIRPNVPAVIEMGQMHIKPVKPLPKDLQQFLDEAREGVVYFSLGSNVKSVDLPENLRKNIIETLAELPYKIVWKWESDHLPDCPKNVITRKWLPQQDILAHSNIKVFLTQGGLQSSEEAISRGVPVVVMPFIGDQPMNARKLSDLGVGIALDPLTVTKDQLKQAIITVAENTKFKTRIMEARDLLYDQPMTGLEKAVWWSEYVIRHKRAKHLRSPAIDMPWYDYYLLDVISVAIFVLSVLLYVCCIVVKKAMFSSTKKCKAD